MTGEIAIIGAGRLGRLLARELRAAGFRVAAADRTPFHLPGVRRVSLLEAARARVVVLALPAGSVRGVLKKIAPALAPGTLVCDVCAVKEEPARWMRELLPASADILGLHPLFGPDSARAGLGGHRIVLCPVRIPAARLGRVKRFLRALGLVPVQATPRAHDRAMARTLFVTQFTGRALRGLVSGGAIRTRNSDRLLEIVRASANDSADVLTDLYRYNRFTRALPALILRRCRAVGSSLR